MPDIDDDIWRRPKINTQLGEGLTPKAVDFLSRIDNDIDLPKLDPGIDQLYVAAGLLAKSFKLTKIDLGALQVFATADFPDNVRGIEKAIKAIVATSTEKLQITDIPDHVLQSVLGELTFDDASEIQLVFK